MTVVNGVHLRPGALPPEFRILTPFVKRCTLSQVLGEIMFIS
jgi:hypothetical protein